MMKFKKILSEKSPLWSFNINGIEEVKALVKAVNMYDKPAVMLVSNSTLNHLGFEYIDSIVKVAKKLSNNRVFIQLDHATDEKLILESVSLGFDAVMLDGSDKTIDEYIDYLNAISNKIRAINRSVIIEAEVGYLAHHDSNNSINLCTDPGSLLLFQNKCDVDLVAVSVGNIHGFSNPKPNIDRDLTKKLYSISKIPFVLHGGDWIPKDDLKYALSHGFKKINIGPEARSAVGSAIRDYVLSTKYQNKDHRLISRLIEDTNFQVISKKMLN